MNQDLADWVRARPWVLVVVVSLLVLIGGSAVALSRGSSDDGDETLAQATAEPSATTTLAPTVITGGSPTVAPVTPSASPTATPTGTASPTATPSTTTAAPAVTGNPGAPDAPVTSSPPRATSTPSSPTVTLPPVLPTTPATATPSPSGRATLTVLNRSGETITFQINGVSTGIVFDGDDSAPLSFSLRSSNSYSLRSLASAQRTSCGDSGTAGTLEAGKSYQVTIGSDPDGCTLSSGTYDRPRTGAFTEA